jgi:hypothetical protein
MEHLGLIIGVLCSLLTYIFGLFSRSFLPSYMHEKAKNVATKEDIKEIAEQTGLLTQTAKEIEAKISLGLWSQLLRWDVQKTALLESLKELASAETFLLALVRTFADSKEHPLGWEAQRREANIRYAEALNNFKRTQLATEIVCGRAIGNGFQRIGNIFILVLNRAKQGDFLDIWETQLQELEKAKRELGDTIRKQLEFDTETEGALVASSDVIRHQSSGSSPGSTDVDQKM